MSQKIKPTFGDDLTETAYLDYMAIREAMEFGADATPESEQAAIKFLGCICDYYLNKQEGDFMKIEVSQTWQR